MKRRGWTRVLHFRILEYQGKTGILNFMRYNKRIGCKMKHPAFRVPIYSLLKPKVKYSPHICIK